jgi:hypothetical protein
MARLVGRSLPDRLLSYLRARTDGRFKEVLLLATIDETNTPHMAMLSHWEAYANSSRSIRLATYDDSKTTRNMERNGRVTLVAVNRRMTYYVKGLARLRKKQMREDQHNSMFVVRVKGVYEDELPGTRITSGITFSKAAGAEPHEALYSELVEG